MTCVYVVVFGIIESKGRIRRITCGLSLDPVLFETYPALLLTLALVTYSTRHHHCRTPKKFTNPNDNKWDQVKK